jgi:uncharacterized protein YerC
MRLVNVKTLELEEFFDNDVPEYAILSHTWRSGEVLFSEMSDLSKKTKAKPGYSKIIQCCQRAATDRLSYVWIDTCSIDKSSSTELTEAINSMYRWYQKAKVCYAFLDDVETPNNVEELTLSLWRARWFTRGWTLQELLAPSQVSFFSRDWQFLGTRFGLAHDISSVTRIPEPYLRGTVHISRASVAQRMSWASERQTTRLEDVAYSLIGLFDVNMPLLYGEGYRAFTRLQEEIIKTSVDQSIFAWGYSGVDVSWHETGVLAHYPGAFASSGNIVPYFSGGTPSFSVTNKGIQIETSIVTRSGSFYMILRCHHENDLHSDLAIPITPKTSDQYSRLTNCFPISVSDLENEVTTTLRNEKRTIFLAKPDTYTPVEKPDPPQYVSGFVVRRIPLRGSVVELSDVYPPRAWDESKRFLRHYKLSSWCVVLEFQYGGSVWEPRHRFALVCGFHAQPSTSLIEKTTMIPFCRFVELQPHTQLATISRHPMWYKEFEGQTNSEFRFAIQDQDYTIYSSVFQEHLFEHGNWYSLEIYVNELGGNSSMLWPKDTSSITASEPNTQVYMQNSPGSLWPQDSWSTTESDFMSGERVEY